MERDPEAGVVQATNLTGVRASFSSNRLAVRSLGVSSRGNTTPNQLVDLVGDALGGVAELFHGPVGGIALGHVLGAERG